MARRSAALALLLLVVLALLAPVSAGGGGACPAESCRECVAKGCGWAPGLACQNKGMFGFGKEVSTAVTQCTPLRDAGAAEGHLAASLGDARRRVRLHRDKITLK